VTLVCDIQGLALILDERVELAGLEACDEIVDLKQRLEASGVSVYSVQCEG